MLQLALEPDRNRAARIATWSILGVNAILLAISLPDYRVSIDSGYHISLAQWYVAHGQAWWDHINFGPGGRPNLQGPALHIAIAILGTILGGTPDRFILANAILGVAQWSAAMLTVLYFARRLGGDMAAMFAVAMIAGSAFAAGSFYVGIPSGWLFISIPWAIYFFLEDRLALATAITRARVLYASRRLPERSGWDRDRGGDRAAMARANQSWRRDRAVDRALLDPLPE